MREPEEHRAARIDGASLIPMRTVPAELQMIEGLSDQSDVSYSAITASQLAGGGMAPATGRRELPEHAGGMIAGVAKSSRRYHDITDMKISSNPPEPPAAKRGFLRDQATDFDEIDLGKGLGPAELEKLIGKRDYREFSTRGTNCTGNST